MSDWISLSAGTSIDLGPLQEALKAADTAQDIAQKAQQALWALSDVLAGNIPALPTPEVLTAALEQALKGLLSGGLYVLSCLPEKVNRLGQPEPSARSLSSASPPRMSRPRPS